MTCVPGRLFSRHSSSLVSRFHSTPASRLAPAAHTIRVYKTLASIFIMLLAMCFLCSQSRAQNTYGPVDYGSVKIGLPKTLTLGYTLNGKVTSFNTNGTITGPDAAAFKITKNYPTPGPLGPGYFNTRDIEFKPRHPGKHTATLVEYVTINGVPVVGQSPANTPLIGDGASAPVDRGTFDYGPVSLGQSKDWTVHGQLGQLPATFYSINVVGPQSSDFQIISSDYVGHHPAFDPVTATIRFTPSASGSRTGYLIIYSDAVPGGEQITLIGEGSSLFSFEALNPSTLAPASTTMPPSVLRVSSFLPAEKRQQMLLKVTGPKNTPVRLYVHKPQQQGPGTDDGHNHFTGRLHGWFYRYKKRDTSWQGYPPQFTKDKPFAEGIADYSDYDSAGNSAVSQVTTDQDGNAYIYYTAPGISGNEIITVSTVDPDPAKRQIGDLPLLLQMSDFATLTESATIELTGQTGNHPDNHYGTETMLKALQALAINYAAEAKNGTLPSLKLPVNDMSLPWGGLFDIDANWDANGGHVGHRRGIEADIGGATSGHGLIPGSQWAKTFENILLAQGWWLNSGGLWNLEKPPHYHILLNGRGTPYIVFPGTVNAVWKDKSQGLLTVTLPLLNRGGIDAASLMFTAFTFTDGVTLVTPSALPVAAPGLLIQVPSTYSLTVKVPAKVKTFRFSPSGYATVAGSSPYNVNIPLMTYVSVNVPQ